MGVQGPVSGGGGGERVRQCRDDGAGGGLCQRNGVGLVPYHGSDERDREPPERPSVIARDDLRLGTRERGDVGDRPGGCDDDL